MSGRTGDLAERRAMLQARCASQRGELEVALRPLERQLGFVDRGVFILQRVASVPLLIGGAIALMFLVGPRRLIRWTGQAALLFGAVRRLRRD